MAWCARAAYHTIPSGFALDSLQAHFIGGPKATVPMKFRVVRLSNGRRFVVRSVLIEQNDTVVLHATLSFVNATPWTGPAMTYTTVRQTSHSVTEITLDDLAPGRGRYGSFMKFQRLPMVFKGIPGGVESGVTTSVAQIVPPMRASFGSMYHLLGIINLSDYHVMDTPLHLSGISFGLPEIGDHTRTPTENNLKIGTTLNHSIHFHVHEGFRADALTYIEVETSWAKDGRAMLHSKIFNGEGLLIATCEQEAFYVLKKDPLDKASSKL